MGWIVLPGQCPGQFVKRIGSDCFPRMYLHYLNTTSYIHHNVDFIVDPSMARLYNGIQAIRYVNPDSIRFIFVRYHVQLLTSISVFFLIFAISRML